MIPKASSFPTSKDLYEALIKQAEPHWFHMNSGRVECSHDSYHLNIGDSLYLDAYADMIEKIPDADQYDMFGQLRMTRYRVGDFIAMHHDLGPLGNQRRALTYVLQLNDPSEYEGGDLVFEDGRRLERKQGAYVLFNPGEYHEVQPVTKGVRYSLVCWLLK